MKNIYVQFEYNIYQQVVRIPMGTKCAPFITGLLLYRYENDFMSNIHKTIKLDLVDMFDYTSRYLDDIVIDFIYNRYPWIWKISL